MVSNKGMFFFSLYFHCGLLGFYLFNVLWSMTAIFSFGYSTDLHFATNFFYQTPLSLSLIFSHCTPVLWGSQCESVWIISGFLDAHCALWHTELFAQVVSVGRKTLQPFSNMAQIFLYWVVAFNLSYSFLFLNVHTIFCPHFNLRSLMQWLAIVCLSETVRSLRPQSNKDK